jgi:hypothetical protein
MWTILHVNLQCAGLALQQEFGSPSQQGSTAPHPQPSLLSRVPSSHPAVAADVCCVQAAAWSGTTWGVLQQGHRTADPAPVFARIDDTVPFVTEAAPQPAAAAAAKR